MSTRSGGRAAAAHLPRSARLVHAWRVAGRTLTLAAVAAGPVFDLTVRLWLAQLFWFSGIVKMADWDGAVALAAGQPPLAGMAPVTLTAVSTAIELICPLLLAAGLATRPAALALLALILIGARGLDHPALFQAALLGWWLVAGAGALSLDRALARGFRGSALPLAGTLQRLLAGLTRSAGPLYLLALRLIAASGLLLAALNRLAPGSGIGWPDLLPTGAGTLPVTLALGVCAVLLWLGLAARPAALLILVMLHATTAAGMMMAIEPPRYDDVVFGSLLLALIMLYGPGRLALERPLGRFLRARLPRVGGVPAAGPGQLPQVVVVGGGFGGLSAARQLAVADCQVTLIDRHNYHLFQPLLYQVATAGLAPSDIATPIRGLFRDQDNVRVLLGRVTGVDTARQELLLDQRRLRYDYLILATGARHAYFGRDDWEPLAPGLKQIDDATQLRRRLLLAFELAENAETGPSQQALLTFVIVGGGPTGVELAGAVVELARHGMAHEFSAIDPAAARVVLIQAGPRLLPAFPERLSARAAQSLRQLGVEVLTDSRVREIDAAGVTLDERRIEARTVFWAAGVVASPAAQWLGAECDAAGRIKVGPDLSVPGLPNVFAIGDTALSEGWDGRPVPGLAPAAKQGGKYVARLIQGRLLGRAPPAPFRYRHLGSLATIGRQAAVADFGWLRLSGAPAWWLWGAVHVLFLAGMRSRVAVALQWFWAYLTFKRSTRLITGGEVMPAHVAFRPVELRLAAGDD